MKEFFTSDRAEEGVELPLITPEGKATEHWLRIRGVDSDVFRLAELEASRAAVEAANKPDPVERDKALLAVKTHLIAALVISWSFEQECTRDNVVTFFTKAPQIASAVDMKAGNRSSFFLQGPSSFVSGIEKT
ncbi:MAG: phage tail assembly chaperone [Aeromonas veronii]